MEQLAENVQQEYWRPTAAAARTGALPASHTQPDACAKCGSEYVIGSRFCHVCGDQREAMPSARRNWTEVLDFHNIRQALGLSTGALIAFVFGIVCVVAAIMVGFIFTANTIVDWQAVQTWRIEWMLAAAVAFIAGILLKRPEA